MNTKKLNEIANKIADFKMQATLMKCKPNDAKPGRSWCIYKHDAPTNKQPKGWPKTYETKEDAQKALQMMHVFD